MALVFPDICRYTAQGSYLGRPTANVMDMFIDVGADRDDALQVVGERMAAAWENNILPNLSTSFTLDAISFVDLNTADGATGLVTTVYPGNVGSLPQPGEVGGNPYAGQVAGLVTKQATARRGQRQGKWYLAGLTETYVSGNLIDANFISDMNTGLAGYLEDLNLTSVPLVDRCYPVVLHTRNDGTPTQPDIVATGFSAVQGLQLQQRVASQRRRNRA